MKTYALIFRMDILTPEKQPTREQLTVYMKQWSDWTGDMSEQGTLVGGNHFSTEGTVLYPNGINIKGPYEKEKISVAGYLLIDVENEKEALLVASKCPILEGEETSVEVREIAPM